MTAKKQGRSGRPQEGAQRPFDGWLEEGAKSRETPIQAATEPQEPEEIVLDRRTTVWGLIWAVQDYRIRYMRGHLAWTRNERALLAQAEAWISAELADLYGDRLPEVQELLRKRVREIARSVELP